MFDYPSERERKKLRPKVKMGGPVSRNGKDVSKEIEEQTARKYAKSRAIANKNK